MPSLEPLEAEICTSHISHVRIDRSDWTVKDVPHM